MADDKHQKAPPLPSEDATTTANPADEDLSAVAPPHPPVPPRGRNLNAQRRGILRAYMHADWRRVLSASSAASRALPGEVARFLGDGDAIWCGRRLRSIKLPREGPRRCARGTYSTWMIASQVR